MLYVYIQFFFSDISGRYLIFIGSLGLAAVVFFFFEALTIRDLRTLLIRMSSILKCCKSFEKKICLEKKYTDVYREFGFSSLL